MTMEALAARERRYERRWHSIDPEGSFRSKWDLAQAIILAYIALTVPFRVGLKQPAEGGWYVLDLIIDLYFYVDVVLNFVTGFEESEPDEAADGSLDDAGRVVYDPAAIAKHYARTWLRSTSRKFAHRHRDPGLGGPVRVFRCRAAGARPRRTARRTIVLAAPADIQMLRVPADEAPAAGEDHAPDGAVPGRPVQVHRVPERREARDDHAVRRPSLRVFFPLLLRRRLAHERGECADRRRHPDALAPRVLRRRGPDGEGRRRPVHREHVLGVHDDDDGGIR